MIFSGAPPLGAKHTSHGPEMTCGDGSASTVTRCNVRDSDASAFVQRETRPAFSANRIGFSLFQERKLARSFRLDYGYRYDHVRWNGIPPDPTIFQASVPVARLITTLSRDTRDSVLDATRGEFSSHSLEFGPRFLGSEIGFTRYYGQYFRYVALDKFLLKSPSEKEKKPAPKKLIYAGALRLGLTTAFGGGSVISPERFFAGGGTTMRGFAQDRLGPLETMSDGTLRPLGGEALFLFNNEIRFPIFGILQGVGFVDIGNVYSRISDFDFNMRKSAGAGIRLKIKFIPLRFDWKCRNAIGIPTIMIKITTAGMRFLNRLTFFSELLIVFFISAVESLISTNLRKIEALPVWWENIIIF